MQTTINLSGQLTLTYNNKSKEFKEALEGYRECMYKSGNADDMLKHVAFYVTRFGTDGMVEGVGYVGYNGRLGSTNLNPYP